MFREKQFNQLCDKFSDDIFRYSLALLGNRADAEDATQEVLLKLWKKLPRIGFRNPRAWIHHITRNTCYDLLRRRSVRNSYNTEHPTSLGEEPDLLSPGPEARADALELREQVNRALQELPETLRSVFLLYEVNGLRYREIAKVLEMPLNSVKVNLSRSRKKLKEILTRNASWILNYTK